MISYERETPNTFVVFYFILIKYFRFDTFFINIAGYGNNGHKGIKG